MRKYFTLLFLIPVLAMAQENAAVQTEITTKLKGNKYGTLKELKAGYDNVIRIRALSDTVKQIVVEISPGAVLKKDNDYVVRVDKPGEVWLSIYAYSPAYNLKLIERRRFTAVKTPEVTVTLAGKVLDDVHRDELLKAKKLVLHTPDNDTKLRIKSFKMSVDAANATAPVFESHSDKLTKDMRNAIKAAKPGTYIYIEYIKVGYKKEQISMPVGAVKLRLID